MRSRCGVCATVSWCASRAIEARRACQHVRRVLQRSVGTCVCGGKLLDNMNVVEHPAACVSGAEGRAALRGKNELKASRRRPCLAAEFLAPCVAVLALSNASTTAVKYEWRVSAGEVRPECVVRSPVSRKRTFCHALLPLTFRRCWRRVPFVLVRTPGMFECTFFTAGPNTQTLVVALQFVSPTQLVSRVKEQR
jgi:hypothetical protein